MSVIVDHILPIQGSPAQDQYKGCGKAWIATNKSGEVVGIRYMHDFQADWTKLPKWIQSVRETYPFISEWNLNYSGRRSCVDGARLGKLKRVAIANGHPETGPRGGYIKASELAKQVKSAIGNLEKKQFKEYRLKCRKELAELGEVQSGMLSCYEFVPKGY